MAYEPKVGDEVVVRGRVVAKPIREGRYFSFSPDGSDENLYVRKEAMEPAHDAGEAELRGEVGGPWAIALSEVQDLMEKRVAALEASAKVRDVPATMVNLAHRVQGLEVANKIWTDTLRERDVRWGEKLDNLYQNFAGLIARVETAVKTELEPEDADPHADWNSRVFMDADGRLKLQNTDDVIASVRAQNDALVERARAAERMTETIRAANHIMLADLQRAEARVERLAAALRTHRGPPSRSEFHRGWAACTDMALATLQADPYKGPLAVAEPKDPAHGANAQASE